MSRPSIGTCVLVVSLLAVLGSEGQAQRTPRSAPTLAATATAPVASAAHAPFMSFESGPVQPMLVTLDGSQLLALNTADGRLEIFDIVTDGAVVDVDPAPGHARSAQRSGKPGSQGGVVPGVGLGAGAGVGGTPATTPLHLVPAGSVFTGLEPVAIARHETDNDIVFVSNNISDTVVVVNISERRVLASLPVGDEPGGLAVFNGRVFVTTARTPEVVPTPGQADPGPMKENSIVVMRANPPYSILTARRMPAVKPRDVTVADGTLYIIPQNSGNRTTLLPFAQAEAMGLQQFEIDAFNPEIDLNPGLVNGNLTFPVFAAGWLVPTVSKIVFDTEVIGPLLPDADVIALNPTTLAFGSITKGVGTTLFDIEHNPVDGTLWVAASDANNRIRFEPVLKGTAVDNRVSIVDPTAGTVDILSLEPPFLPERRSQPVAIEIASGSFGDFAYVASHGTASVLVIDAATRTFVQEIDTAEMPLGLEVDESRGLLFVYTRGDQSIRAYDIADGHAPIGPATALGYDPEPPLFAAGRGHLYDARDSHGNGSMSCATCHIFAHHDSSAWDLGDPGGSFAYFYPDIIGHLPGQEIVKAMVDQTQVVNHPMKGPMTTQSLRGLIPSTGGQSLPLHWRGDRRFFQVFRNAFVGLQGGTGISHAQMQEFAGFARMLAYPPNPYEPKNREYTGLAATGRDIFGMNPNVPGKQMHPHEEPTCITCHFGDFASDSDYTGSLPGVNSGVSLMINMPTLRGVYEKEFKALTGFGVLHDGEIPGVRAFFEATGVGGLMLAPNFTSDDRDAVTEFVRQWDTGISPLVGAQVVGEIATAAATSAFLNLAEVEAEDDQVDLTFKATLMSTTPPTRLGGHYREVHGVWGYQLDTDVFLTRAEMLSLLATGGGSALFTCVPPGTGGRYGIDRDEDGLYDFAENAAGTRTTHPDTDGDGYLDGFEALIGADPLTADASLPDVIRPAITSGAVLEVFADVATLSFFTDEPVTFAAEVSLAGGGVAVSSWSSAELRRRHDVILDALPAGTELTVDLVVTDRNGNSTVEQYDFETAPPLLHVDDVTLGATGAGPYDVTATVRVVDHAGMAVAGVPVMGFWDGDIGGANWQQEATTDAMGVATFALPTFTPTVVTPINFTVAYVGTSDIASPYFVGAGTPDWEPDFFYEQSINAANQRTIELP